MKISLVIPAYNEKDIIADTVRAAVARLESISPDYELIVVDDGSTDGTCDLIRPMEGGRLRLLRHSPNRGKGAAVRAGVLAAAGDYIFCTDADLAYGLENIPSMLAKLEDTGCDLVIGSRRLNGHGYQGYPLLRLISSKGFALIVRIFSGLPYDTQCGIKGYRREAARALFSRCATDGFAFDFEILLRARRAGMAVEQEAVTIMNHQGSTVNILPDSARMFRDLLRIRARVKRS